MNYYKEAVEYARKNGRCGIVGLQRHLKLGLSRVQDLIYEMEKNGVISSDSSRKYLGK